MKKLLVICGPTGTGKTSSAIHLAKKFKGELVSADSRQVYKGMDIGTGKDLPKGARFYGYYKIGGVKVWGYDLVEPNEEFSVARFIKEARKRVGQIWSKGNLPMLVGGTGLYIKGVVDGIATARVPQNKGLRKALEKKAAGDLFEQLAQLDPAKAGSMNLSDRKNPRRLVRAIEVADWSLRNRPVAKKLKPFVTGEEVLFLGLSTKHEALCERIEKRVRKRVGEDFDKEVKTLLGNNISLDSQAMTSLGYKLWVDYLNGKITKKDAVNKWAKSECEYAKRQMGWFRKDTRINWFDVAKKGYLGSMEKEVQRWYSSLDAKKD